MKVMLPILRTSGAMNLDRNDYTKRKLSSDGQAELNNQVIHSPAQLAEFSITKQFMNPQKRKGKSLYAIPSPKNSDKMEEWEKRVTYNDLNFKKKGSKGNMDGTM